MPIQIQGRSLAYLPDMRMGLYLRFIIAPALRLDLADDTVLAKICTPDLRVVFSAQARDRLLGDLLQDDSELVIGPWPQDDAITRRSLMGNAGIGLVG